MPELNGASVLVTGATGFIGSALAKRLVKEGARVHALLRPSSEKRLDFLKEAALHRGDLEDAASLAACLKTCRPSVVFHLAKDRSGTLEQEKRAIARLAMLLRDLGGAPRLVRAALAVRNGHSPAMEAALAASLNAGPGLTCVTLDLMRVYGPGQDASDFPSDVMRAALAGQAPGAPPGGSQDFVFVDDVVEAFVRAASVESPPKTVVQIGSGRLQTGASAAALALRLCGKAASQSSSAPDPGGHPADISSAWRTLGWEPSTSLEEGFTRTLAWCRQAVAA